MLKPVFVRCRDLENANIEETAIIALKNVEENVVRIQDAAGEIVDENQDQRLNIFELGQSC